MRSFKPLATATLSLAFAAVTAYAAVPFQVQQTTVTTSESSNAPGHHYHHKKLSHTTTGPDGTTVSTSHSVTHKADGTVDTYGEPAVNGSRSEKSSESTTTPDGSTQTNTESHSTSTTTTP